MRSLRALVPAVALVFAFSCSEEPTPVEADAGVEEDAGLDAGATQDGGATDAGSEDAGSNVYPPVTAADYCQKYADAVCGREVRCGMLDEEHRADCRKSILVSCGEGYLAAGVAEGRVSFDEAAAGNCVGESEELGCHFTTTPAVCGTVTVGLGVADSPCFYYGGTTGSAECAPGHFCYKVEGQCPFKCVAFKKADEPCGTTTERCDTSISLTCDFETDTCKPRKPEGAECLFSSECAAGHFCDFETDMCRRIPPLAKRGEPCETSGGYPDCEAGLYCRPGPLDPNTGERLPGSCHPQIAEGGACTGYGQCQAPLYCNAGLGIGTCQKPKALGQTCDNPYYSCRNGAFCDEEETRTCRGEPTAGESCEFTFTCSNARCDFGQTPYTCVALLKDNEPCQFASHCESGRCAVPPGADGGPVCLPQCAP